tara:strand:+ start:4427 stop:5713 length:1287 start_codon:yes stop_codon:yes gene_type:complete
MLGFFYTFEQMNIEKLYNLFKQYPNICTDSRKIKKASIFFALKGENFNGNEFAGKAIDEGCAFAVIDEKQYAVNKKCILVNDVLSTLQELAKHHRNQLKIPIIGITGSNGKTTSKELINAVLNTEKKCYATKGNLNNHIGVPLSVLEINFKDEIAIIEMGANHIDEIAALCEIARPDFGIITNIGKAHLEGFGSVGGVKKAKSELYQFIAKTNGKIFVNNEDNVLLELAANIKKATYGKSGDYTGTITSETPFISLQFGEHLIDSNLIGNYQFSNIMLAIAIGKYFRISDYNIKQSINNYTPKNNRSQIIKTEKNTLILDAYNANPASMNAMLTAFAKQEYNNKLCILGDMLELGEFSAKEHKSIIQLTHKLVLESIFIGNEFLNVEESAFKNTDEFSEILKKNPIKNRTVLLKGSRGIAIEKLIKFL